MTSNQLVFLMLAGLSALAAVGVVAFPSPVRSALSLIVNFFVLAFVYFTLGAQMLGITQILVYTGAVMVLFLFAIMLLNLGAPDALRKHKFDAKPVLAFGLAAGLFGIVFSQVILPLSAFATPKSAPDYGSPQAIGQALFTGYVFPFEIASVLLLVGIVGSILLAKRRIV